MIGLKMKKKLIYMAVAALAFAGCTFDDDSYVDFTKYDLEGQTFKVTSASVVDPADGAMLGEMKLPGGQSVREYLNTSEDDTKATGTSATNFVQQLLKYNNKSKVIEISGTYPSIDEDGNPIVISGKLIIPEKADINRIILCSHYTIGSNAEAPSNTFPLEGVIAPLGYALICPDYIGYGVTNDRYHPYLMMDLTARNVVDMYLAVKPFLEAIDRKPLNDDIYLCGYSQGGGTTIGVLKRIETVYGPSSPNPIKVKRVFAGGGIYDIKYTFESFVESNYASYPCGVPFVVVGQVKAYHLDNSYLEAILQPRILNKTEEWFLDKRTTTNEMNTFIDTHVTSELLTPEAMNRTSTKMAYLYQLMTMNSVVSYAWEPEAPIYMMHSIDDNTVPYGNATRAQSRWTNANIQYNFGHYGTHQKCCLRFIYTVRSILKDEE